MQLFIVIILSIVYINFKTIAVPVHNRMMFYQAEPPLMNYYNHFGQHPYHQAVLVHYNQPSYWSRSAPTNVAAFVAGGGASRTGSYFQNGDSLSELEPLSEPVDRSEQPVVSAVAEAFPESDESPKPFNDELPVQNEVNPSNKVPPPYNDLSDSDTNLVPPAKPLSDEVKPVVPAAADVPTVVVQKKKKKFGSIPDSDSSIENDDSDNDDDEDDNDFYDNKKPGRKQNSWPLNTFFPMNFGQTSGGAIAIANSFSTGKGGTASSHATAYGSAAKQRSKKRRE